MNAQKLSFHISFSEMSDSISSNSKIIYCELFQGACILWIPVIAFLQRKNSIGSSFYADL
jgi:hypothetical protein